MENLEQFRSETAAWLERNCPPSMRTPYKSDADMCWGGRNPEFQSDEQKLWLERNVEHRWTVPTWPQQYGGAGLSKAEHKILREEMERLKCRRPLESFGIDMLGPALFKFGSDEQKKQHLPKIARAEIRWCQGYSEPNSGSDLASLQTKAEDKGDHYLVNGSKIWTSYADQADWIFCLVRTDSRAAKHAGISFLLFDMASDGVSTAPIRLISGNSPFCQTYFQDVKVPKDNLVGELNDGWTIAKYLLTHEREMISGIGGTAARKSLGEAAQRAIGLENGRLGNTVLRRDIAQFEIDALAFFLTSDRGKDEAKAGQGMGAVASMYKYYGTELNKRRMELELDIQGSNSLVWEGEAHQSGLTPRLWLRSKGNSIEGGTSEIQLNIVAKHVLGLPDK